MTWGELLSWVKDPKRTREELKNAADGLRLSTEGKTRNDLRKELREYIERLDTDAPAVWTPESPKESAVSKEKEVKTKQWKDKTSTFKIGLIVLVVGFLIITWLISLGMYFSGIYLEFGYGAYLWLATIITVVVIFISVLMWVLYRAER